MADGSLPQIRTARPTVNIDGRDDASLSQGLMAMNVHETLAGMARCELVLGNWGTQGQGIDFLYFDRKVLDFGKALVVKVENKTIFEGKISALEGRFPEVGPPQIAVLAEDRFQELRMTRRTRSFEDLSDADLVRQIASAHGLTAEVDMTGPKHKVIAQVNQSDLALLRDRTRAVDAEVWMAGTTLHAQSRSKRRGASLRLTLNQDLHELQVVADLAHQRTALVVGGWDVASKAAIKIEGTDAVLGAELGGRTSGASIVQSVFGARKETIAHSVPWTSTEAQARAEGHFRAIARTFVTARGVAETTADLRVGAFLELASVGPLFNGVYFVSQSTHLFDTGRGLRTEFAAERPWLGK